MSAPESALRSFFLSPRFAVLGASSNPSKYGHKVFRWYIDHSLPVTPINPTSSSITIGPAEYPTLSSLSQLPNPKETGLSVITPPSVTLKMLE